jgi:thiol:disulfide interchange protein
MKKITCLWVACTLLFSTLQAQETPAGIQFFKGTFEQALKQAAQENKLIFLDAYASWCGPCVMLSRNVFPDKALGDYFNAHFINVKIDWESLPAKKLQARYPLRVFPSLMYIDAEGTRIAMVEGYKEAEELLEIAKTITAQTQPK